MDSDFEVSRPPTKQLLRDMRGAEAVLPAGVTHYRGLQGVDVRALAARPPPHDRDDACSDPSRRARENQTGKTLAHRIQSTLPCLSDELSNDGERHAADPWFAILSYSLHDSCLPNHFPNHERHVSRKTHVQMLRRPHPAHDTVPPLSITSGVARK